MDDKGTGTPIYIQIDNPANLVCSDFSREIAQPERAVDIVVWEVYIEATSTDSPSTRFVLSLNRRVCSGMDVMHKRIVSHEGLTSIVRSATNAHLALHRTPKTILFNTTEVQTR